jgi:type II secretory pathway component GspD/PulD (secretin)
MVQPTSDDVEKLRPPATDETQEFFKEHGLTFPDDAYIRYSPAVSALFMYNTSENHRLLASLLGVLNVIPTQVQIDLAWIAFDNADIETLARKEASAAPNMDALIKMWQEGKGAAVSVLSVMTRSGVNAQIQDVTEVIYPTTFEPGVIAEKKQDMQMAPTVVLPGGFETRERGTLFNVTPTVAPSGDFIDLTLAPVHVPQEIWRDLTGKAKPPTGARLEQPQFRSRTVSTSIVVKNGKTLVVGGWHADAPNQTLYLFITPRVVDSERRPVKSYFDTFNKQ